MSKDPWTDPDPQPGDFDAYLETLGPDDIHVYEGDPNATLTILPPESIREEPRDR